MFEHRRRGAAHLGVRVGGRHRGKKRVRGGGIERDQLAHRVPARVEILAFRLGGEQRCGVGAAEMAEQRQRHTTKAAVAPRGADMREAAGREIMGTDRQARRA